MSLKDRFNSQPKTKVVKEAGKVKPKENLKKPENISPVIEGFGILDAFLIDESISSIYVSGAKNIYVEKKGVIQKSMTTLRDNVQLTNLIKKNAGDAGVKYDENAPYIKLNYKEGVNISATLPPLSNVPVMFIKSYHDKNASLTSLQEIKAISKEVAMVIETLVATKANILIAGNPQTLKTTLLSTMAKLLPQNSRGVLVDFQNEFKIDANNFTCYDFLTLKNDALRKEVLRTIFNSNPSRTFINDCDEKMFCEIIEKAMFGYKGITATINAYSVQNAIDTLAQIILKQNPGMDFENAKMSVLKMFDVIILCNKSETGFRRLSEISEPDYDENKTKGIISLNKNNEHVSLGYVPKFCSSVEESSLGFNINIFDANYKHTYCNEISSNFQLKRPAGEKVYDIQPKESFEKPSPVIDSDEQLKKVQERFEELKKNIKLSNIMKISPKNTAQNEEQSEYNLNG